jgi:hypothetical protein
MGRPFAHTANVIPLTSPAVFATYFSPGTLLIACSGAAVEFAWASVVFDGAGVSQPGLRVLKWHADTAITHAKIASERRMTVPCMPHVIPPPADH